MLYKIIIESGVKKKIKILAEALLCLMSIGKKHKSSFVEKKKEKPGLHTEMQFHKLLNRQQASTLLQQRLGASLPILLAGVEQPSGSKGDR